MTAVLYLSGREGILDRSIDLVSGTLIVHGVSASYVFDVTDETVADLGANILSSSGDLTGRTFTDGVFNASNPSLAFVTLGQTVDALVLATGSSAGDRLVSYVDQSGNATLPWVGTGAPVVINFAGQVFALAAC